MPKIRCRQCGQWFEAKRSDAKTCSPKCRVAAHREARGLGQIRNKKKRARCDQCSKSFWTDRPDHARFCSDECRFKWHNNRRES